MGQNTAELSFGLSGSKIRPADGRAGGADNGVARHILPEVLLIMSQLG